MATKAGRPPVFQQARGEAIAISSDFQIPIMDQDIKRICNALGSIVN